jgi:hypothetical protein
MKTLFKYAGVAFAVQVVLLTGLGLLGNLVSPLVDVVFERFLWIYEPIIVLLAKYGHFKAESAIIEPVWMGVSIGVLTYSVVFGFLALLLKRVR